MGFLMMPILAFNGSKQEVSIHSTLHFRQLSVDTQKARFLSIQPGDGFWQSTIENNTTNPDAGGIGWINYLSGRLLNVQTFLSSGTYTPTLVLSRLLLKWLAVVVGLTPPQPLEQGRCQ